MSAGNTIDVAQVIDDQKFGALNIKLMIIVMLLMGIDGYDASALAYSAPALMKAWNIGSIAALGPVLSASIGGILIGGPLFGYLGDRIGRKNAIVAGTVTFGFFTLISTQAGTLTEMLLLRILAGAGMGGLFPLSVAIINEFAPKNMRATLVNIRGLGVSLGAAVPGPVAAWLIPQYGWEVMFWIGGAFPLVMAVYAYFALPESIKFLALQKGNEAKVTQLLTALQPGIVIPPGTQYVVGGEVNPSRASVASLFSRQYAAITASLWLVFVIVGMTYYFFQVWMVTILTHIGVPLAMAAIAGSMYQLGGAVGAVVLCRPMDRRGLGPILILFVLSIPAVLSLDLQGLSPGYVFAAMFAIGVTLLGLKSVINTAAGMLYPTALRSTGVGWAVGVGAAGSVVAIVTVGVLLGAGLTVQQLFLLVAGLMAVATVVWLIIIRLQSARLREGAALITQVPLEHQI